MSLSKPLLARCRKLEASFDLIPTSRQRILEKVSKYINDNNEAHLLVVCTHNSRRSHIAQLWLAVAALFYRKKAILSYSAGTETTAFHPNAITALRSIGFQIDKETNDANPIYRITLEEKKSIKAFSKLFNNAIEDAIPFAAIMVCEEAEESCPIIPGSALRIALPFNDPKKFDNAPDPIAHYVKSSDEIGREMLYIVQKALQ